jgi:6,7-dimethyl-8-ribityllumazine synthase
MIRSVHKLIVAKREQDYRALVAFFEALGMASGESWNGKRSKGVKFEARQAGVEVGFGEGFPDAGLVIETDSADVAYEMAVKRGWKIVSDLCDTDWGATLFAVEMPAGEGRLAIFSYKPDWRRSNTRAGKLDARGLRFAIVVGRFNAFITERLLAGAQDALLRLGAEQKNIVIVRVPGSFEIPAAARMLAETGKYNAVICLGCLIRGDTAHYEVIANEVTRGIGQSAQETGVPHAFGVLTCDTLEQAIDRAGLKAGNKGHDAALAAVEMAQLNQVDGRRSTVDGKGIQRTGLRRGAANSSSKKKQKQPTSSGKLSRNT